MKTGTATKKIPGGKLIRVDAQYDPQEGRVEWVKITGDFFLHPEETLESIEERLDGAALPLDRDGLAQSIADSLREHEAELIGVAPEDIVATLAEALA